MQTKKRAGRPARELSAGERVPMSFRVPPDLKHKMDAAAAQSGRSVAQEIELRLVSSFRDQDVLIESLKIGFGPELAAFLLLIGGRISTISKSANFLTGTEHDNASAWLDHPYIFNLVVRAVSSTLEALRPAGDRSFRVHPEFVGLTDPQARFDEALRNELAIINEPTGGSEPGPFYRLIRELLGEHRTQRIAQYLNKEAST